jgi:hypothetical protein
MLAGSTVLQLLGVLLVKLVLNHVPLCVPCDVHGILLQRLHLFQ